MKNIKHFETWIQIISILGFITALFFLPFLFRTTMKETPEAAPQTQSQTKDEDCEVFIGVSGNKVPIPLEEYIIGVVAAEMPVNFHLEALKAQAIAARTYVLKTTNYGQSKIEPTVAHQVFYDEDTRKENWDTSFEQFETKVKEAVKSTEGKVIHYNDELITAMFHSMSNGMTESAKNYSGNAVPYLQSVASTDFQYGKNYESSQTFTIEEWNNLLNVKWNLNHVKKVKLQKNNTGRVEKVTMQDVEWTGRDFRTLLDLRSTDFTIEVKDSKIVITTEGYGHGVGMSQYGADALAKQGRLADEIIQHYYTNTTIRKYSCKK